MEPLQKLADDSRDTDSPAPAPAPRRRSSLAASSAASAVLEPASVAGSSFADADAGATVKPPFSPPHLLTSPRSLLNLVATSPRSPTDSLLEVGFGASSPASATDADGDARADLTQSFAPVIKSGGEFAGLMAAFLAFRRSDADVSKISRRDTREYYERQNELVDFYVAAEETRASADARRESELKLRAERALGLAADGSGPVSVAVAADESSPRPSLSAEEALSVRLVSLAISASFGANILLLAIKLFAAATSGSLAVIASTIDSVMDLISGAVIFFSARLAARRDPHGFPIGKSRFEPLGIIIFAALMGAASLQLISEGVTQLATGVAALRTGAPLPVEGASLSTFFVLGTTIAVKLALFAFCRSLRHLSGNVGALALDHFADCITNAAPLAAIVLAARFPSVWWLDPTSAIGMSVYMISMWATAAAEQMVLIAGKSATPKQISEIAFLALTNSPAIEAVDTVLAYQLGNKLQVEVDIVLARNTPLFESHDIGEALQRRIERLDNVERTFVHLDYEWRDHSKDDEHYNPYDQAGYNPL